jgi:quinol monooxygenase YgiN
VDAERRRFNRAVAAAGAAVALVAHAGGTPAMAASRAVPVVRISRGNFDAARLADVERLVRASQAALEPGLRAMRGLLAYYAAVDAATSTVVNVSVWEDIEAARQMDRFGAMLAQRPLLEAAGVTFGAIANYEPLWTLG